ncbi:MAG TPA: cupredoxin domain-containing protein [Dehalococcoidia bacterium]|jgi:predicted lipoprotein with Yx(FWY)xxD motif
MKGRIAVLGLMILGGLAVACGGGGNNDKSASSVSLGSVQASDHGTKDISKATSLDLEVDDFYFAPTFIKGTPGQTLSVNISNDSNSLHNFSVQAAGVDQDIQPKGKASVKVTLPQSGVLLFICKYHTSQGMNGELLAGDATPQAVAVAAPTVKVGQSATLGPVLTNSAGLTLYTFKNDVPNSGKSVVNGNTAVVWPPLILAGGTPVKPAGLTGDLTLITRDDGSKQVAYKGQPLYVYSKDTAPGDTNGQNVGGVWLVAAP